GSWMAGGTTGNAYVPPSFLYSTGSSTTTSSSTSTTTSTTTTTTPPAAGTSFVSSFTPSRLRTDFSGWVGMRLKVGSSDLQVSSLGRWVVAGNTAAHTVKLVDAATGADVAGGSVSVATAGAPAGAFRYATLAAPLILRANSTYYLVT